MKWDTNGRGARRRVGSQTNTAGAERRQRCTTTASEQHTARHAYDGGIERGDVRCEVRDGRRTLVVGLGAAQGGQICMRGRLAEGAFWRVEKGCLAFSNRAKKGHGLADVITAD